MDLAIFDENIVILTLLLDEIYQIVEEVSIEIRIFSQEWVFLRSLLTNALILGSIAVVRPLHRSSIDIRHEDDDGNTTLHLAVGSRRMEYVKEMLEDGNENHKHKLDACDAVYKWRALLLVSRLVDAAVVRADAIMQVHLSSRAKDHAAFRGWGFIA